MGCAKGIIKVLPVESHKPNVPVFGEGVTEVVTGSHGGNDVKCLLFVPELSEMWSSSEDSFICVWSLVYDDAEVCFLSSFSFLNYPFTHHIPTKGEMCE